MLKIKTTKNFFFNSPSKKIFFTFLILFIYRFCNTIPLSGIDQEALKHDYYKSILVRDCTNLSKLTEGDIKWQH